MILDTMKVDQGRSIYIAYYLFKNIEKETNALADSLKKEASTEDAFREFKTAVEKEADSVKSNLLLLRECI
jgi:predicted RNA-binding protein YlxR (DUF448 family)